MLTEKNMPGQKNLLESDTMFLSTTLEKAFNTELFFVGG